ncbi:M28 family peptidase [Sphingosinithalassobacter sp. LHW66-3]|uniref:M28 family peptidase n=1 Tax=Sphingosinithalassobacter sp. LHW66-3 TaxID=3424718 RepID=UPI003D6A3643
MRRSLLLAASMLLAPLAATAQTLPQEQAAMKAHVSFLASDALRGREAGTADHLVAAEYMVSQMIAAGLQPGGTDGSWYQQVPLVSFQPGEASSMRLLRDGTPTALALGSDFVVDANPLKPEQQASGDVVFAGFGISDEALGRNDYSGLDIAGKIAAVLVGVPQGLDEAAAERLGAVSEKVRMARAAGAAGVILIESQQQRAQVPWAMIANYLGRPRMTTLDGEGQPKVSGGADNRPLGLLSREGAEKLFAGSTIDWASVRAAETTGEPMPTGPLGVSLDATVATDVTRVESPNVIGLLPGSDPVLRDQYLVLSAHLDHVGVGEPDAEGDTIYNGAMDNAIGNATLIEVARQFQRSGNAPRRSILFISLTAEEKGLLGSSYFAANPTVPVGSVVGDINFDMPIISYPLVDVVVLGQEHSTLGPATVEAAEQVGLTVVPDPLPEENFFVRSDHYSFVQAGIPAISIDSGPGGEGAAAIRTFLDNHYHEPSDEIGLINWQSAAKFADLTYTVVRNVADADARPAWNPGNEYGVRFNGYGAQ